MRDGGTIKAKRCKVCRGEYVPRTPLQAVCGITCAKVAGQRKTAKQKEDAAKAERKADRAKREALKRKGEHLNEAQAAFNAFIRYRDRDLPCICCGSFDASGAGGLGGGWDAGHWLSRGHAPHLRFHEQNVHKQRKGCNRPGGTTRAKYRLGLVARIGELAVSELEALEYAPTEKRWSIEELKEIKVKYREKLRQLRKEMG